MTVYTNIFRDVIWLMCRSEIYVSVNYDHRIADRLMKNKML